MRYPAAERQHHTRVGWWIMTHDRGGPAVLGAIAAMVSCADIVYAALNWHGSLPHAYLGAVCGIAALGLISFGLRFLPQIGIGKSAIRWKQRTINSVLMLLIAAGIGLAHASGDENGAILGMVAGLSGSFALYTGGWLFAKRA